MQMMGHYGHIKCFYRGLQANWKLANTIEIFMFEFVHDRAQLDCLDLNSMHHIQVFASFA